MLFQLRHGIPVKLFLYFTNFGILYLQAEVSSVFLELPPIVLVDFDFRVGKFVMACCAFFQNSLNHE